MNIHVSFDVCYAITTDAGVLCEYPAICQVCKVSDCRDAQNGVLKLKN